MKKYCGFMESIIQVIAPIMSCIFTAKLLAVVIGFETPDQKILVICLSAILNIIELVSFYYGRLTENFSYYILGFLIGIVSVSGSLGYLQVNFERGAMESTAYQLKLKEIEDLRAQIRNLNDTAERQRRINHLTKSAETLRQATPLLSHLNKTQAELDQIKNSGAGIGGALYRIYAKLFSEKVENVAIFFNLFIAVIIEIAAVVFNVKDVRPAMSIGSDKRQLEPSSKSRENGKSKTSVGVNGRLTRTTDGQGIDVKGGKRESIMALYERQVKQGNVNKANIARQVNCSRQYVQQVIDSESIGDGVKRGIGFVN